MRLFFLLFFLISPSLALNIHTTIKPIASLVFKIVDGTDHKVSVLYRGSNSPHSAALSLKDVEALKKSDLFIWVGTEYETAMAKHFKKLDSAKTLELISDAKIKKLPPRFGHHHYGEEDRDHQSDEDHDHNCEHDDIDGHIWLSIENAKTILKIICDKLSLLDPQNKPNFENNLRHALTQLDAFHKKWASKEVSFARYMTFHDFTAYLDNSFGTHCAGVMTQDAGHTGLSAKHIESLIQKIKQQNVKLFLKEPQFSKEAFQKIAPRDAQILEVDYLGSDLELSADLYEKVLEGLLKALQSNAE